MSELINKSDNRTTFRGRLLAGVSALTLAAYISSSGFARAEDTERPILWIELGGQLSELQDGQETFAPPLMDGRPSIFDPSQKFEKPPKSSIDEYGELSFRPVDSDWVFSAQVQFGRSKSYKHYIQQTNPLPLTYSQLPGYVRTSNPAAQKFAETQAGNSEQHAILDFEVGKDVGLGFFGRPDSSSLINFGVRFAQFRSTSNFSLKSDPDWHFSPKYFSFPPFTKVELMRQAFHSNLASMTAQRSFHGVGPSVSWKSSIPVTGNLGNGEIAADWGINGAVLFGRQKARTHHQSTARYAAPGHAHGFTPLTTTSRFPATPDHTRSRAVTVPNIGGFAGLSFKYNTAKVSIGYRGDFFFGAMDGGIDAAKKENVGFYGPFASVSVGIGG